MGRHHLELKWSRVVTLASIGNSHPEILKEWCVIGALKGRYVGLQNMVISETLKAILAFLCSHQNLPEDQCIFIRGFRVVRTINILSKQLKGAACPNPSLEDVHDDNEPDKELISTPASMKVKYSY